MRADEIVQIFDPSPLLMCLGRLRVVLFSSACFMFARADAGKTISSALKRDVKCKVVLLQSCPLRNKPAQVTAF